MNTDELTRRLDDEARKGVAGAGSGLTARLAGVRHRVQVRRRRRVAAGTAGVALAVLGVFAVVPGALSRADRPPAPADRETSAAEVDRVFPARNGDDDPRVAATVGRKGQTTVRLRFVAPSGNLGMSAYCSLAVERNFGDAEPPVEYDVSVNGKPQTEGNCDDTGGPATSFTFDPDDPAANARDWQDEFGVRPGQPVEVLVRYFGAGVPPGVVLGAGVYELSGPRVELGDRRLPATRLSEGRRFRLADGATTDLAGRGLDQRFVRLTADVGSDDLICWGTTNGRSTGTDEDELDRLTVGGQPVSASSAGGQSCGPLDEDVAAALPAGPVELDVTAGSEAGGSVYIAVYRPER